jgi:16S rRNA (uracil1498-N3)-methyltransferase
MRLTRVHVDAPLVAGQRQVLNGSAANHISRVLRLRGGDALTLFDGRGGEYAARIESFAKDSVVVDVREQLTADRESPLILTLAQGISRGERMDWVIQKATELGTTRIVPVFTERSVVRLDDRRGGKKLQHWRGVAIAACEQSGRNRLPDVTSPVDFPEFLASVEPSTTRLLLSPSGALRLEDVKPSSAHITVLIGPEGGLSEAEQEAARSADFRPIRLGPRILRTETAAIAALTLLQREFGDL